MCHTGSTESHIGHPVQSLLCIVGDAQPRLSKHEGIIGPVAHDHRLIKQDPLVAGDLIHDTGLSGSVYDATSYSFVLSASPDLSGALASADVTGTAYSYADTLDYETTYYWQVTAWKDGTMLSQSDIGTFAVAAEEIIVEPPAPTPAPEINIPPVQQVTPTWMYVVIAIGIALIVVVIVLIVRSRRSS